MRFRKEAFERWLRRQDLAEQYSRCESEYCPIANWLLSWDGNDYACVTDEGIYIEAGDYPVPRWVNEFITRFDAGPGEHGTVDESIGIVEALKRPKAKVARV